MDRGWRDRISGEKNERMPVGKGEASSLGDKKNKGDFHKLPVGGMSPCHY